MKKLSKPHITIHQGHTGFWFKGLFYPFGDYRRFGYGPVLLLAAKNAFVRQTASHLAFL